MKRVPMTWSQFLDGLSRFALEEAEAASLDRLRSDLEPREKAAAARALIESLVGRRRLLPVSRRIEHGSESLVLFDPSRRVRLRLTLPALDGAGSEAIPSPIPDAMGSEAIPSPIPDAMGSEAIPSPAPDPVRSEAIPSPSPDPVRSEAIPSPARDAVGSEPISVPAAPRSERIALPLKMSSPGEIAHDDLRKLLRSQSNLIAYDRVLSPRELASRFQHQLEELFPGVEVAFHAVEMPARSAWPQIDWNKMPVSREELEACVARRDHLVRGTLPDGSSFAILPAGDAQVDWSGFLLLKRREGSGFDPDSLALATLAIEHFSETLSTLMRLEGLIFYDFLTGIYNRSYYEEQIEKEVRLTQRRDQSMALLIVDIDDFKGFNTRYGYDGGDRVLATVACILKSALRGTDTLARYGGEEFAVILAPPVPREEAVAIAERLRAAVAEEPFEIQDLEGRLRREQLTVSIGGALFPEHGTTSRELWAVANRLILDAKQTGKNTVRFAPSKSEVR